jgi:N-methylhydantoinase A
MADLIRKASLERGHDPREFVIVAYGGAGPVHCGAYAAELGCRKIVVPPNATAYSAFGAAVSDLQHSFQVAHQASAPGDVDAIRGELSELESKARRVLRTEGISDDAMRIAPWADMRYKRQFYELRIPLETTGSAIDLGSLRALTHRFEQDYASRYGEGARHGEHRIEYVRFGVEAIGRTPRPAIAPARTDGSHANSALKGEREVYWREHGGLVPTPLYDGTSLAPGSAVEGPAVIEHPGTSIAVHPGQVGRIDSYLNTIIELEEGPHDGRRSRHL